MVSFLNEIYETREIAQFENQSASNIVNFRFKDFQEKQYVVVPDKDIRMMFDKQLEPILVLRNTLGSQNQKLKEARDILLPRIMNQTITV